MNKKSFTLVEIMIVLAIILLLAAIAILNIFNTNRTANAATARTNIRALSKAADLYSTAHNGAYPVNAAAIVPYIATATSLCASTAALPVQGYVYDCTGLTAAGYTLTATPASATTGDTVFSVTTGGTVKEAAYTAPKP